MKSFVILILRYLSDETHWMIGNDLLPNRNFPLVFESVSGECERDAGGTSFFNQSEVRVVIKWIKNLIESKWKEIRLRDIGIVSPYKKQCDLIEEELDNNGFDDISVGSAETYQGQEKKIIIVSTVRTSNQLGFVSNEQVMQLL